MALFDNQNNFRVDNQLKLLYALRNGPASLNDLAADLNVSFTAIVKIVDQLVREKVLVYVTSKKTSDKKRGRKPTFVKINTKVGVTCALDLSSEYITVGLCSLDNKIICKEYLDTDFFVDRAILELIAEKIKALLATSPVENKPLLGICISAPGMINKTTGEFAASYRLRKLANTSIPNFFFNIFGVPINIYNDVKIGMVGERIFGCIPSEAQSYMFANIGAGCSVAFSFNGLLYQGKSGYSGELSNIKDNDWFNPKYTNNHLECLSNMAVRINKYHPELKIMTSDYAVDFERLFELYTNNDPHVLLQVDENAKTNAIQFIAYNDLLDLEYIVVSGSILRLGDYYKKLLLKYIEEMSTMPFRAKVIFSKVDSHPSLYGAMYQANNLYFLRRLEQMANKKSSSNTYDISKAFGNNI